MFSILSTTVSQYPAKAFSEKENPCCIAVSQLLHPIPSLLYKGRQAPELYVGWVALIEISVGTSSMSVTLLC